MGKGDRNRISDQTAYNDSWERMFGGDSECPPRMSDAEFNEWYNAEFVDDSVDEQGWWLS